MVCGLSFVFLFRALQMLKTGLVMFQKPTCQITKAPFINSDTINKCHDLNVLGGAPFSLEVLYF